MVLIINDLARFHNRLIPHENQRIKNVLILGVLEKCPRRDAV